MALTLCAWSFGEKAMRMITIAVALGLAGCAGSQPVNVTQVCAEVAALAPLVPLVSAADLAIPTAGPIVAAANNMLAAAANGTCADPAAVQALVAQIQAVILIQTKTKVAK